MKITITWFPGQYPSFNLGLHSIPDRPEFLSIKGCRIVDGKNGPFVSYPATKKSDGKYWNHCYGSEDFNKTVLEEALKTRPATQKAPAPPAHKGSGFDNMTDDIPW